MLDQLIDKVQRHALQSMAHNMAEQAELFADRIGNDKECYAEILNNGPAALRAFAELVKMANVKSFVKEND